MKAAIDKAENRC